MGRWGGFDKSVFSRGAPNKDCGIFESTLTYPMHGYLHTQKYTGVCMNVLDGALFLEKAGLLC